MNIPIEYDMFNDMMDITEDMSRTLSDTLYFIDEAINDNEFVDIDIDNIIMRSDLAHENYIDALDSITKFDKRLAELIALRGKFAEETGIPMFSHIGEDKRVPEREEYSV